jgi:hypothetical protein
MLKPTIDKKQKMLLVVLVIIFLITGGILYWNYGSKSSPDTYIPEDFYSEEVTGEIIDEEIIEQELGNSETLSVLEDPRFNQLKLHGQLPIEINEKGRDNPFEPY